MEENNTQQNMPHLCRKGCGFYGNPNFDGLCSKCHRDTELHQQQAQQVKEQDTLGAKEKQCVEDCMKAAENLVGSASCAVEEEAAPTESAAAKSEDLPEPPPAEASLDESSPCSSAPSTPKPKKKNRCSVCKKKVGLTGFNCHCGGTFCCVHRYSDTHDCQYDYREKGQTDIRSANPQITAAKIQKI